MTADLKQRIKQIICEVAELDDCPETTSFADLGIDSMMALEVVSDIEREYGISIEEQELADLTNLKAVFDKVSAKVAQKN